MTNPETSAKQAPTCYKHPNRETWVTCGRCGKPLCPDCMIHGPVGVRCKECLLPQGKGSGATLDAEKVKKATTVAIPVSLSFIVLLAVVGFVTGTVTANALLSMIAGGVVGWTIWRICQRTWNGHSIRLAILLGALIPLVATVLVFGIIFLLHVTEVPLVYLLTLTVVVRTLVSTGLSVLMAWLLATNTM